MKPILVHFIHGEELLKFICIIGNGKNRRYTIIFSKIQPVLFALPIFLIFSWRKPRNVVWRLTEVTVDRETDNWGSLESLSGITFKKRSDFSFISPIDSKLSFESREQPEVAWLGNVWVKLLVGMWQFYFEVFDSIFWQTDNAHFCGGLDTFQNDFSCSFWHVYKSARSLIEILFYFLSTIVCLTGVAFGGISQYNESIFEW